VHPARALVAVKVVHTVVWALLAGCVVALPVAALAGRLRLAAWLGGAVLVETAVLVANGWRCPLTDVAARFTDDRRDNFDIYLPLWVARHNKEIFGTLYVAGLAVTAWAWLR
jgi:hypothetical protein